MKIALTGASGLIGTALSQVLRQSGHEPLAIPWRSPWTSFFPESAKAVFHLAGEPIANRRWSAAHKKAVKDSRVEGTRRLVDQLIARSILPNVVVAASATGFYGDRGDEPLDEEAKAGTGFLPELCQEWEAAWHPLEALGVRVVKVRFGIVLARQGGALPTMLIPIRFGVGGRLGDGNQYWSWIALSDVISALLFALTHESLRGPVNLVTPQPVRNSDFTTLLGRTVHRPVPWRVPAWALRLAVGEMADSVLLASARVVPQKLIDTGFHFAHPSLEEALRFELDR